MLDINPLVVWASAIGTLLAVGTTIWNLITSGSSANAKAVSELVKRVETLERTCERQAERIAVMPNQEMMHRLDVQLVKMDGELGRINERLKPVAAIAERMQELMLEQARTGPRSPSVR